MKIIIGSDKSGFSLKEAIVQHLNAQGVEVCDVGTKSLDHGMPFYEVAPIAVEAMRAQNVERAILICGTGMGMSQVANKYQGVYAACCESEYAARMCRAVNNSNVLCLGGWIIAPEMGIKMVDAFLGTGHTEGLEPWRAEFLKQALAHVGSIDKSNRSA